MKLIRQVNVYLLLIIATLSYLYWPDSLTPSQPSIRQKLSETELFTMAKSFKAPVVENQPQALSTLGEALFFDARFSSTGKVSCSTCHKPELDFTDGLPLAIGVSQVTRNTPTIINAALMEWFFWDGRAHSLATQAMGPIESEKEHQSNRGQVAHLLYKHYKALYEQAFGPFPPSLSSILSKNQIHIAAPFPKSSQLDIKVASYAIGTLSDFNQQTSLIQKAANEKISPYKWFSQSQLTSEDKPKTWTDRYKGLSPDEQHALNSVYLNFGRALAAYQKDVTALNSPFDIFLSGLENKESPEAAFLDGFHKTQWQGFKVFAESGCINCHNGPNFTDQQFHNIGLPYNGSIDIGRAKGILQARSHPISCETVDDPDRESCQELKYLDDANFGLVGAFKTPSLRNLIKTAPYMHDGRFRSLQDVLNHYEDSEIEAGLGHRSESMLAISWTENERKELEAFLLSLQSEVKVRKKTLNPDRKN